MAFTGETKYGLKDGQFVGNFGSFALFVRIIAGKLRYVGKGSAGMTRLNKDWMKAAFPAPEDAALFDKIEDPGQTNDVDNSEPVASFVAPKVFTDQDAPSLIRINPALGASYTGGSTTTGNPSSTSTTNNAATNGSTGGATGGSTGVTTGGATGGSTGSNLVTGGTNSGVTGDTTSQAAIDAAAATAKKKKTTKIILIAVGVIVALGAAYYFMKGKN